ncbi:MAG: single-stranded-DNA-specific exonuclease RecJ [Planctomycetota bacterium]
MSDYIRNSRNVCKSRYEWKTRPTNGDPVALAAELKISPVAARALINRGYGSNPDADPFMLTPRIDALRDPRGMKDMDIAVKRLIKAIQNKEKILVYGDYDADGVCSAAVTVGLLEAAGAIASAAIPEREREGYGLSEKSLPLIAETTPDLILTVDNGVTAHQAVAALRALNIDVIVTDHHLPEATLPDAVAVVNPMRADCRYPFKGLSGAGVAFQVCRALALELSGGTKRPVKVFQDALDAALPLVALATVADVMPLLDENRAIVRYGLAMMPNATAPGVRLLAEKAMRGKTKLRADAIGYQIGPRINAAGRMGEARTAYDLLRAPDEKTADDLFARLDELNNLRQRTERALTKSATAMVSDPAPAGIVVSGGPDWHPGVLGIVAGRLSDQFNRPTVAISFNDDGDGKGSARSITGVDIRQLLEVCASHLTGFGGHSQAAGLSLKRESLDSFISAFVDAAAAAQPDGSMPPFLLTDGEISLSDCNQNLVDDIARIEPFGEAFPSPLFIARGVRFAGEIQLMGKSQSHLSAMIYQPGGRAFRAVGFNLGDRFEELKKRRREGAFDFVFEPSVNEFNGNTTIELMIKDFSESES